MHIVGVTAGQEPEAGLRQCGRCRQLFDGDPTIDPTAPRDWWLCPPCRTVLLGPGR